MSKFGELIGISSPEPAKPAATPKPAAPKVAAPTPAPKPEAPKGLGI